MRFDFIDNTTKGILYYLKNEKFKGNDDKYFEEVKTYATSTYNLHSSQYAIDFDPEKYWHADDFKKIGTQYIVIYLESYYIRLTGFSITSSQLEPDFWVCHPKNWGFDASNDNETWENQVNYTDTSDYMNRKGATKYVGWNFGVYKYFRIMNTGEQYDTQNKNSMDLSQVEFFGDLLNTMHTNQCLPTTTFDPNNFLFIFVLIFL